MTIDDTFDFGTFDDTFDFGEGFFEDNNNTHKSGRTSLKTFLTTYVLISKKGGNSVDVARELGISPQAVRQRVGKLILQGVKLPKLGNICRKQQSAVS